MLLNPSLHYSLEYISRFKGLFTEEKPISVVIPFLKQLRLEYVAEMPHGISVRDDIVRFRRDFT